MISDHQFVTTLLNLIYFAELVESERQRGKQEGIPPTPLGLFEHSAYRKFIKCQKCLGAILELPVKQHCQSSPFTSKLGPNRPNWQCCLTGSSKRAPRILIFSIAMGADYSFYLKFITTRGPTFFGYIISVLTSVR